MITQLYIRNFALIDELDISFTKGFSVITGETGAGKSIILGAIGLLLGQRAENKYIKEGADKCIVEAHFDLGGDYLKELFDANQVDFDPKDTIIRRELYVSGKSRTFVNDTPVALTWLKTLGDRLLDVHSQHQNLLLAQEDFQLKCIDLLAQNKKQLSEYQKQFNHYNQLNKRLEQLKNELQSQQQNEDYLRFVFTELQAADIKAGEQEELEAQEQMMSHAEELKEQLTQAQNKLSMQEPYAAISLIKEAVGHLRQVQHFWSDAEELNERLDNCYIEIKDIVQTLSAQSESMEVQPHKLAEISERLNTIYSLQKKYHLADENDLIEMKNKIQVQLDQIDNGDQHIQDLQCQIDEEHAQCLQLAEKITQNRKQSAARMQPCIIQMLNDLGMENPTFEIIIEPLQQLGVNGIDKISYLFSANRTSPQPISKVASGGEIARVMLSIKAIISQLVALPTIIFDEIDTGVSGRVAENMAKIMQDMGKNGRQVIAITHLPQIAAMGKTHYKVSKKQDKLGVKTQMQQLDEKQRVEEIAQMLSGASMTKAAVDNAKSLLKNAENLNYKK